MQAASRAVHAARQWLRVARPTMMARVRLFTLLLLLAPLFAGLQYLMQEGVPRVEIRFVSEDVPVVIPVERIVERIVERVIYVAGEPELEAPEAEDAEATPAQPTAIPTPPPTPLSTPPPTPGADAGPRGGPMADRRRQRVVAQGAQAVADRAAQPAASLPSRHPSSASRAAVTSPEARASGATQAQFPDTAGH